MATIFQTPKRMASFPGSVAVFKVKDLPTQTKGADYWKKRIELLSNSFGISNENTVYGKDFIYNQQGPLQLKLYTASDSFLFFNRDLAGSSIPPAKLLGAKQAKLRAIEVIRAQGLLYNDSGSKFQTFYAGAGYTEAQTANAGVSGSGEWLVSDESEPYKTEIRSHFGYLLHGLPVFGPGAKTIISNYDDAISEEIHFWRNPGQIVFEREIISPETAISRLCKENQFVKVMKLHKKYPGQSSGRFYDDVQLGYYATPPSNKQRFYIPVYKIRGTFESRIKLSNQKPSSFNQSDSTFRYDFTHFVSAMHGDAEGLQMNDFKRQIVC
jgi:hypothetical protein